ncbi:MAG: helix-turn-helix transcriptional regulator [Candidatus Hadarchaeota archaeon]|nr:helix-turn-helix transcriptional regulator [Candidatus Hadarchaeota archaeon]
MKLRFDGLSEFVSRRARVRLLRLILDNGITQRELATEIGVTRQAVNKWLNPRETHPKNGNLDHILDLAHELDGERTSRILQNELLVFAQLLSERLRPGETAL